MNLEITIHNIKCINDFSISLPINSGLYAITGQNGSGKSTITACASSVFFNLPMKQYFGVTENDAYIYFRLGESERKWYKVGNSWQQSSAGDMNIKGFFEGSLLFGNRFKDMTYDNIKSIEFIDQNKLIRANDFIRKNLGVILQGDEDFYEKLWMVSNHYEKFKGNIFFYEKKGKRVSQFHMSTGENLLISILNSLYIRNNDRANLLKPCIIFLDEIELALHPSSLKRLLLFLNDMAKNYNYAIYFSTHSLELIGNIKPENIFYIERHTDNSMSFMNPCYPAYATRFLYDHNGYDKVILVEDDLAKLIVDRLLRNNRLLNSKLVHVLPCGGYTNVIDLANDVVRFHLLGRQASICIVLDGDVKEKSQRYIANKGIGNNIPINYLPIESLEKFLRQRLFVSVDHTLKRQLNDYFFHNKSLDSILEEYKKTDTSNDVNGKKLYERIENEMNNMRIEREVLIEYIVNYLIDQNDVAINNITTFLTNQMR